MNRPDVRIVVYATLATPSLMAAVLMAIAGVAWGAYSSRGRGATTPLAATTRNFVQAVPLVLLVSLFMCSEGSPSRRLA